MSSCAPFSLTAGCLRHKSQPTCEKKKPGEMVERDGRERWSIRMMAIWRIRIPSQFGQRQIREVLSLNSIRKGLHSNKPAYLWLRCADPHRFPSTCDAHDDRGSIRRYRSVEGKDRS